MHYEINVSRNGAHFFATAPRSLGSESEMLRVYREMRRAFPDDAGYRLDVTRWSNVGERVEVPA